MTRNCKNFFGGRSVDGVGGSSQNVQNNTILEIMEMKSV